jgi:hypothetical protein
MIFFQRILKNCIAKQLSTFFLPQGHFTVINVLFMWRVGTQEPRLQGKLKQVKEKSHKGHNKTSRQYKCNNRLSKYSKKLFCYFCKMEGHTEPFFPLKQQKKRHNQLGQGSDLVLITKNLVKNSAALYDECL